ncbi:MAG: hypothetical protein SF028_03260 [Candidatus Sumerlaeia bacterium]|nr:hypothetical protein [Candidatus Sumerlaeia bacterium]
METILRRWAWDCFDQFGRLVAVNVLLCAIAVPAFMSALDLAERIGPEGAGWVLFTSLLLFAAVSGFGTLWFAPLLWFLNVELRRESPPLRRLWDGLRTRSGPVFRFLAACGAIAAALWSSVWFYAFSGVLPESLKLLGYTLSALSLWMLLFLAGVAAHGVVLAAREDRPLGRLFRLAAMLSVARARATFISIAFIAVFWFFAWLCQLVGVLLIAFSATVVLLNALHEDTLRWQRRLAGEDVPDDEHYTRTVGEVLRPWQ